MSPLVWLTIPLAALLLAVLWVVWASRSRPRADTHETVQAYERFRAAFESRDLGGPLGPGSLGPEATRRRRSA